MMDFYDLLDTYAGLHDIDLAEALHLWYRGAIDAGDLLEADLENEGIYNYREHLINMIKVLNTQMKKDKREW